MGPPTEEELHSQTGFQCPPDHLHLPPQPNSTRGGEDRPSLPGVGGTACMPRQAIFKETHFKQSKRLFQSPGLA